MIRLAFAAAVALMLSGPAVADPRPAPELFERIDELVAWIGDRSDYPGELERYPAVVFLPRATLNYMFFEGAAGGAYNGQDQIEAMYVDGMMFLGDDFALGEDDYKLLHELVHHLQFEQKRGPPFGMDRPFACRAEQEREAYKLQIAFVEETGRGEVPDPIFMAILRCHLD